jgi:putative ABC transport system substrate-binding protein
MRRRELIVALGTAAMCPLTAHAQADRMRRVALLLTESENDPDALLRLQTFRQALQQSGWIEGHNIQIEVRWNVAVVDRVRAVAAELIALAPDVIVPGGAAMVGPLLRATRTIPIVFVLVADPVGAGFVQSLAHPGGNATGFTAVEYGVGGKWLALLKQLVPSITRAGIVRDPGISAGVGLFNAIQAAAPSLGIEVVSVDERDPSGIEHNIDGFARGSADGLVVTPSALAFAQRDLIVALAAKHKLPAIYPAKPFVTSGGLAAYTPSIPDEYRLAAGYVDRVLKGTKPRDLPVQNPTKYEFIVNLNAAKALGLQIPTALLATADEVIE